MNGSGISILAVLFMEAFVSIHMSLFVLVPLSKIISKENSKKTFWILFSIRAVILLFVYLCLIFFHFSFVTYAVGLIIRVVYAFLTNRYQLMKYLKKGQVQTPGESLQYCHEREGFYGAGLQ